MSARERGQAPRPDEPASEERHPPLEAGRFTRLAAPRRRWHRLGQALLVLTVVGATAGVLGIVVRNGVLLGRMTTDVSQAQRRASNLSNGQREALRLLQQVTELDTGGSVDAVEIRLGLLRRQLAVARNEFPDNSDQARELRELNTSLSAFPWARLGRPARNAPVLRATARQLVSQVEVRVKSLYDQQEKYFYEATRDAAIAAPSLLNVSTG